jgi:hypothetical protein
MKGRPILPVSREELFSDDFLLQLLHSLDPKASLGGDARVLLEKVALDFIESVGKRSIEACEMRRGDLVLPNDIQFALETDYGLHISGGSPPFEPSTSPSDEYMNKLAVVKDFLMKSGKK